MGRMSGNPAGGGLDPEDYGVMSAAESAQGARLDEELLERRMTELEDEGR